MLSEKLKEKENPKMRVNSCKSKLVRNGCVLAMLILVCSISYAMSCSQNLFCMYACDVAYADGRYLLEQQLMDCDANCNVLYSDPDEAWNCHIYSCSVDFENGLADLQAQQTQCYNSE